MVVPPGCLADVSMDLPPTLFFLKTNRSHYNSAEMRFSTTANVGTDVCGFRSEGHGGASFDTRDQEPVMRMFPTFTPTGDANNCGQYGGHNAAHKASNENNDAAGGTLLLLSLPPYLGKAVTMSL